jgi:hypothetical protein
MIRRSRCLALVAGIGLAFAMATSVFGYVTQVPHSITVSPSSSTMTCGRSYVVRAQVLDLDGLPIKQLTVTWSFGQSPSSLDRIKPATSKTNANGVATTRVKLACVLGDRVIRSTVGGITGSAVVHVNIPEGQGVLGTTGTPGGGTLPNTSTLAADTSTDGLPNPAVPAIVVLLATWAIFVRRFAFARR